MTTSFLFMPNKPGIPEPIKLQEQHKAFFPLDKPITEDAGRLIGEWAKGGTPIIAKPSAPAPKPPVSETKPGVFEPKGQAEEIPAELFKRIEAAPTFEALLLLKDHLKRVPLESDDKKTAIALLTARHKQLSTTPAQPAEEQI